MKQPAIIQIAVGVILAAGGGAWHWVAAVLLLIGVIAWWRSGWPVVGALLIVPVFWLHPLQPPASDLHQFHGQRVTAIGTISEVIGSPEQQRLVIKVAHHGQQGRTIATLRGMARWQVGDQVRISGTLDRPPVFPDFDYRSYLAAKGIHSQWQRPTLSRVGMQLGPTQRLQRLRDGWRNRVAAAVPQPTAGFLVGITVGDRSLIDDRLTETFRRTGTSHVLALSGYNISIIIVVLIALFGRRPGAVATIVVLIAVFVLFVGPSAAIGRAAISGSLLIVAQSFGRPQQAVRIAMLAAAVLLLTNPWSIRYDIGFDLSFLATLGILRYQAPLAERLSWLRWRWLIEAVAITLAATASTAWLVVLSFGTVSVVTVPANLLIVPFVPLLMAATIVILGVGLVLPPAAPLLGAVVGAGGNALLAILQTLSSWPSASLTVPPEVRFGTAILTVLIALALLEGRHWMNFYSGSRGISCQSSSPGRTKGSPTAGVD